MKDLRKDRLGRNVGIMQDIGIARQIVLFQGSIGIIQIQQSRIHTGIGKDGMSPQGL